VSSGEHSIVKRMKISMRICIIAIDNEVTF
jgi:hypothetical protein